MTETTDHPAVPSEVERTVLLDAEADRVLEALTSADVLTAWLGDWHDGDATTVVTDEGVARRVERHAVTAPNEVSWRWSPVDDPGGWSDVRFVITTEGEHTRLTVTETLGTTTVGARASSTVLSAAATAPAVSWLRSLMALGAVLAVGSLVPA